jgi:spore maturation protein CgeB
VDETFIPTLKEFGFKNILYLPHAFNPDVFRPLNLDKEDLQRYQANISFVGDSLFNVSIPFEKFLKTKVKDAITKKILEDAIRVLEENPLLRISSILKTLESSQGGSVRFRDAITKQNMELFIEYTAASKYRLNHINVLSDFDIVVYGKGWEELPLKKGVMCRGIAWQSEKVYNASKINLNLTVPQLRSGLNTRPFEVLGCKAFLLSDYRRDLGRLFELGKEIAVFSNPSELKELAGYFLDHPKEREEIAEMGYSRALKDHTYKERMRNLIEEVKCLFGI